jgi:hypothetical protein
MNITENEKREGKPKKEGFQPPPVKTHAPASSLSHVLSNNSTHLH